MHRPLTDLTHHIHQQVLYIFTPCLYLHGIVLVVVALRPLLGSLIRLILITQHPDANLVFLLDKTLHIPLNLLHVSGSISTSVYATINHCLRIPNRGSQ